VDIKDINMQRSNLIMTGRCRNLTGCGLGAGEHLAGLGGRQLKGILECSHDGSVSRQK
jgi:hypothetical protein